MSPGQMQPQRSDSHTAWVEIRVNSLMHNLAQVRGVIGSSVKVMAVVKADAYGHGMVEAARAFVEGGTDYLGVTTLEEGLHLRKNGIEAPVLIFSPLLPSQMEEAILNDLDQTVCESRSGELVADAADRVGKTARIHVKVDTGMGWLGINADSCPDLICSLLKRKMLEIAGVYTHFATADTQDNQALRKQTAVFSNLLRTLSSKNIPTGLRHAANSAAILNTADSHFDMVRPGTLLYGQYPLQNSERRLDLLDTWCLKTRIVSLRKLPIGVKIGYGGEYTTSGPTVVAMIPIGYAHGFTLIPEGLARRTMQPLKVLANRMLRKDSMAWVTVQGERAPVIGRVSMQMSAVDVTNIPNVDIGDEVLLSIRRTTTSARIPRVYIREY